MAKQARERAVREKRALKQERKREAAHLRLAGESETPDVPADDGAEPGLRLVAEDADVTEAAEAGPEGPADEDELRGAHA